MSYYHEYIPPCRLHRLQQIKQAPQLAIENYKHSNTSKPPKTKRNKPVDTWTTGIAPALFLGQCFSLLSVSNALGKADPVFRWISFRVLFSSVVSFLLGLHAALLANYLVGRGEMTVAGSQQVFVFYLSSCIASCLYVRLSSQWASLRSAFERTENRINFYGSSAGLRNRMRTITAVVLIFALVEHIFSQVNTYTFLEGTVYRRNGLGWLESLYSENFPYMKHVIPFTPVIVIESIITNFISTFVWNYNDLFIMLNSVAMSWMFRQLNNSIAETSQKNGDAKCWRQLRETYNEIASLTKNVNRCLSLHILLSFMNNFYFICMQLLHTVRSQKNTTYDKIYVSFSFGFLVLRTAAVCLLASSVHEESRECKSALYAIPSESYSEEACRFLYQVLTDEIALTGANFFKVTRSFFLTVVGTITTYEVVLIQFNDHSSKSHHSKH